MHGEAAPTTKSRKRVKVINAVDLFCGAGGTSSGLIQAVNSLGYDIKLTAINHWDVAIATHTKNHEDVTHFCQSIETLNPTDIIKGGRLQLLVASPECTHHSRARGGKPRSDQKRADAWLLMRWIEKLYVENILIENVKEFVEWGPLTAKGLPDQRHKGVYFRQFVETLKVNYTVEYKTINCADHGDPTTRERFFLIAKRGYKKIVWPNRTHASRKELAKRAPQPELFENPEQLKPWVAAREIIDWDLEGKSIFGRKKALSPNTMKRIFAGLIKYSLKPFTLVPERPMTNRSVPRDIEEPVATVTGTPRIGVVETKAFQLNLKGSARRDRSIDDPTFTQATATHQGVVKVESFVLGQQSCAAPRNVDEPLPTISGAGAISLVEVEPFIVSAAHGGNTNPPRDIDEPLGSVLGTGKFGVVEPFVISAGGPELDAKTVDEPMWTILTRDHQALVEAFLVKFHGGENGHNRHYPVDEPMKTIDTSNRFGLVEVDPFIFNMAHTGDMTNVEHAGRCSDIEKPLATVAGKGMFGVVEPFLVPFFGEREGQEPRTRDVNEPAPTVTTHGRMGVCEPYIVNMKGQSNARSIDEPTFTQTKKPHQYLAEPYIVKFYGNEKGAESINDPLDTVTSKDRFGLCIPSIGAVLDIRFRMLQPHELAAAMSFPKNYEFTGNREQKVKQIGNAVPLETAKALCRVILSD